MFATRTFPAKGRSRQDSPAPPTLNALEQSSTAGEFVLPILQRLSSIVASSVCHTQNDT